jgi:BirA family biotin operon repressor/biotin-[acetyl-CoA-carboxylase] ligase
MAIKHYHFESLECTQDTAFHKLDANEQIPFLVSADEQAHGRGRLNREWHTEKGRSLVMSLVVSFEAIDISGLSLVVGLAVDKAMGVDEIKLKWPNDLMLKDQKVGGILIESRSQGERVDVVIGVGINLLQMQQDVYSGINQKVDPLEMAEQIVSELETFRAVGFKAFKQSFEAKMWHKDDEVVLRIDGEEKTVQVVGVSDNGCLKTVSYGELSLNDQGEILVA